MARLYNVTGTSFASVCDTRAYAIRPYIFTNIVRATDFPLWYKTTT